jgi:hypothetical protein
MTPKYFGLFSVMIRKTIYQSINKKQEDLYKILNNHCFMLLYGFIYFIWNYLHSTFYTYTLFEIPRLTTVYY